MVDLTLRELFGTMLKKEYEIENLDSFERDLNKLIGKVKLQITEKKFGSERASLLL